MEIPKYVRRENRKYKFVKKYPNYYMYQDVETGVKECFQAFDLGLVEEKITPQKANQKQLKLLRRM